MSLKRKLEFPTNYIAKRDDKHINYDFLITNILKDKGSAITWLQEKKLIADSPKCSICGEDMKFEPITGVNATSDGFR